MKKITFLSALTLMVNFSFSQEETTTDMRFSTNFSWETFQPFEITNNDSIPDHNQLFGVGFDWQIDYNKWCFSLLSTIGYSNNDKFGYKSRLSSYSAEIYGGRKIKLGKDFEIIPMIGYNYNGYAYRIANTGQVVDFDEPFTPTLKEFTNSSHRISPRIIIRLFDDFQFASSYHWDVSKNRWDLETGTLLNSPRENFSSFRFSLAYFW